AASKTMPTPRVTAKKIALRIGTPPYSCLGVLEPRAGFGARVLLPAWAKRKSPRSPGSARLSALTVWRRSMKRRAWLLGLATCLCAAWAAATVDPRENNFRFFVDGVQIDGVVGYRIEFTRTPLTSDDQRRL